MTLGNLIYESWVSISASRVRTFLAMLGIVIGVGSVVLMMAIGAGSNRQVEQSLRKMGTNVLIVTPGSYSNKGLQSMAASSFTVQDALMLSQLPSVGYASASTDYREFQVLSQFDNWNTNAMGITPDALRIQNWTFARGANFTYEDVQKANRVVVLGNTVAEKLFGKQNPVAMKVQINSISFKVVGVLAPKGQSMEGRDLDNIIFVPITTAQRNLWGISYRSIIDTLHVQAVSKRYMGRAENEVRDALRARYKLKDAEADNFNIMNLSAFAQIAKDASNSMSILLAAIASISLVVGGIGIMNIMLVTVSERTREIGIRKAIGASEHIILMQFLLEAIFIACAGSLMGLAAGFGLGFVAEHFLGAALYYTIWSVVMSLVVACGVGIASGIYPAYKAAKLQPIEALRVA